MIGRRIKLSVATVITGATLLSGATAMATQPTDPGDSNPHNKVTICHATASQSNPYVTESPNANRDVSGHDGHSKDIIPPFDYNDNGQTKHYSGKNWTTQGQAIYNNDCKEPGQGGGTTTTNTQVGTAAQAGQARGAVSGQAQAVAPQGGVAAGTGGAKVTSAAAVAGLAGSVGLIASGVALARKF